MNTQAEKFIIGPTLFDQDEQLYNTKLGVQSKSMPLHYTCHGKTEKESRTRAEELIKILAAHYWPDTTKQTIEPAQSAPRELTPLFVLSEMRELLLKYQDKVDLSTQIKKIEDNMLKFK